MTHKPQSRAGKRRHITVQAIEGLIYMSVMFVGLWLFCSFSGWLLGLVGAG